MKTITSFCGDCAAQLEGGDLISFDGKILSSEEVWSYSVLHKWVNMYVISKTCAERKFGEVVELGDGGRKP